MVSTDHPDEYDATTEANVLDAYVRQQMADPGDTPIITVSESGDDEGEVVIPDTVDRAALAGAECVYAGITDIETGIDFDDWRRLDNDLESDPEAVAESAADTPEGDRSDVDRAFLRLQEIVAECGVAG